MADTVEVEGGRLRGGDHGANGDAIGVAGQLVTATGAACAPHDFGAPEPQQNLLDVVDGQTLAGGDVAAGDRSLGDASRQMQGADDAVLGQGGDAHSWTLCPV